mmetsp:Transcript_25322/g.39715  ORF Transcript_25322/g.39715 Transcript_25322/m.39715 type:complete len:109 (+) Transcript_25322:727-1053(+)
MTLIRIALSSLCESLKPVIPLLSRVHFQAQLNRVDNHSMTDIANVAVDLDDPRLLQFWYRHNIHMLQIEAVKRSRGSLRLKQIEMVGAVHRCPNPGPPLNQDQSLDLF